MKANVKCVILLYIDDLIKTSQYVYKVVTTTVAIL